MGFMSKSLQGDPKRWDQWPEIRKNESPHRASPPISGSSFYRETECCQEGLPTEGSIPLLQTQCSDCG